VQHSGARAPRDIGHGLANPQLQCSRRGLSTGHCCHFTDRTRPGIQHPDQSGYQAPWHAMCACLREDDTFVAQVLLCGTPRRKVHPFYSNCWCQLMTILQPTAFCFSLYHRLRPRAAGERWFIPEGYTVSQGQVPNWGSALPLQWVTFATSMASIDLGARPLLIQATSLPTH